MVLRTHQTLAKSYTSTIFPSHILFIFDFILITPKMMILGRGSLQLLYALMIFWHMQTSIGFNSTTADDEVRCIESEKRALLAFKHGLVDEHGWLSSWGSEEEKKDCCKWEGIQCSNKTGHITGLNLDGDLSLRGNLSPSLFELQHLTYLDISFVDFNLSRIPESVGLLNKIQHLRLHFCELGGSLPSQLGNLTSLQFLDLSYNNWNVENLESLSHLSSLKYLDLSENDLSQVNNYWLEVINKLPHLTNLYLYGCNLQDVVPQSIPMINTSTSLAVLSLGKNNFTAFTFQWLFNLSNSLVCLHLSHNQFQGFIPKTFSHMTYLEELHLADNQFEGEIPKFFSSGNLSLRYLSLGHNNLSGTIPKSIGLLSNLEVLDISYNSFNGVITEAHFSTLSKLWYLGMSSNHLSIKFSHDWIPPFQLEYIGLGSCKLGPDFPSWLQTQRNYSFLNISTNGILDSIPSWFWNLSSGQLIKIYLSSNQINGFLPDLSTKFSSKPLRFGIDLSGNNLGGPLPSFPANTTFINLSKNRFSGSISSLCNITEKFLMYLDLSHNQLSGELPNCIMRWSDLEILNLAHNHFFGEIPTSIGSLSWLETLDLQNNSFSGEIPSSLRNCSALQFVGLSYNKFYGTIPHWIGERLSSLNYLFLTSNQFVGEIPLEICQLTNLLLLELSNNKLSGHIPSCLGNLTALTRKESSGRDHFFSFIYFFNHSYYRGEYIDKASVMWKGKERTYDNLLKLLKIVDLSSNRLTGEIPQQIWNLSELIQLNLSRNCLTGMIPPDIGKMRQLESLDLSHNRLSGQLPPNMSLLYSLSNLDLSCNNFSGRIPSSTQMDTFNASAFVGNPTLCGPPLTLSCRDDEKPTKGGVKYNQQDEDEFWKGFKPSVKLGMALGFLGVLAYKLDHPWKYVCFLLFNYMKVYLMNLKDYLSLIVAALCLMVTVNVGKLRRKLKF